jgi:hypothetical protein
VSKAFLEACNEADGLWRRVQLDLTRLPARDVPRLSNWLHAHAASIRVLVLYGRALSSVDAALRKHVKRLAAAVGEASGLQQLYLARPLGAELFARMDPLGLPHLRSVGVDLAVVDDDWLERQQELESHEGSLESLEMMLLRGRLAADTNHSKHLQAVWHVRPTQADVQRHATNTLLRLPALSGLLVLSGLEVGAGLGGREGRAGLPPIIRHHCFDCIINSIGGCPVLPLLSVCSMLCCPRCDPLALPVAAGCSPCLCVCRCLTASCLSPAGTPAGA